MTDLFESGPLHKVLLGTLQYVDFTHIYILNGIIMIVVYYLVTLSIAKIT